MIDLVFIIKNFLDSEGRLVSYPSKHKYKLLALLYLSGKFEHGKTYSEKEVNQILKRWHTFGDWAMLRRDLYDKRFINRTRNCSTYWLEDSQPTFKMPGLEQS